MDFLEVIENMRAEEADAQRLFGQEGRRVRASRREPGYERKYKTFLEVLEGATRGNRFARLALIEALSTSDFPLLFGDVIDRALLGYYQETPQTYRQWAKVGEVPDFRTVHRFAVNGAEAHLEEIPELDTYPEAKLSDQLYEYRVSKHGRALSFSWESIINDDLSALQDIPRRFGRAARRSEERFATALVAPQYGAAGSGKFYSPDNGNVVEIATGAAANNPPLVGAGGVPDADALRQALKVLSSQRDVDGEPIVITEVVLMVPPALRVAAEDLMNATEIWRQDANGNQVHVANWMRAMFKLAVNPYLPIVDATHGDTAWYLFAAPEDTRPALEVGFLRGHDAPEVFMKDPNTVRIGGGGSNPLDGDFDTDAVRYKVRHVFGGTLMDPKVTVMSTGAGAALAIGRPPELGGARSGRHSTSPAVPATTAEGPRETGLEPIDKKAATDRLGEPEVEVTAQPDEATAGNRRRDSLAKARAAKAAKTAKKSAAKPTDEGDGSPKI